MAGRVCYRCKQAIEQGDDHEVWERLRETAASFGDQRIYASLAGHALRFRRYGEPVEGGGITVRPGDVIRIPSGCLDRLPAEAVRMVDFEKEAHQLLEPNGLTQVEKRRGIEALPARYAFLKPAGSGPQA